MSISELSRNNHAIHAAEHYVADSSRHRFSFTPSEQPLPKWQRCIPDVLAQRSDFAITASEPRVRMIQIENEPLYQYNFATRNQGHWQIQIHEKLLRPPDKQHQTINWRYYNDLVALQRMKGLTKKKRRTHSIEHDKATDFIAQNWILLDQILSTGNYESLVAVLSEVAFGHQKSSVDVIGFTSDCRIRTFETGNGEKESHVARQQRDLIDTLSGYGQYPFEPDIVVPSVVRYNFDNGVNKLAVIPPDSRVRLKPVFVFEHTKKQAA